MDSLDENFEVRTEVLKYSLVVEDSINKILLINLGIHTDGTETKLFGQKDSLSFKNKIDLLYDIDVLSKVENQELELFIIFRNKFLHNISCNSFLNIIKTLDNGLINRFKKHFDNETGITDENGCRKAYGRLYLKNLHSIREKIKIYQNNVEEKRQVLNIPHEIIILHIDFYFDMIDEILLILSNSNMENEEIRDLSNKISTITQLSMDKFSEIKEQEKYKLFYEKFLDEKYILKLYGVLRR